MTFTRRDHRYFNLARQEASTADFKVQVGCVVIYKNHIISQGHSSNKTHPNQFIYNKVRPLDDVRNPNNLVDKVHAEILALSKIQNNDVDWSRVKIYVYRETRNGNTALSRPCPACMKMIKDLGIKHIYYTTSQGYAYEYLI